MKCPICGGEKYFSFGSFSFSNKLRASCSHCNSFWEVDGDKIELYTLESKDKTNG